LQGTRFNKHLILETGFVYRWTNVSNNKWYIGSHCGDVADSYVGSGKAFLASYKKNISFFSREIIYVGPDFREIEELILKTLNAAEDRSSYNLKNSAIGGNTSMHFTDESRKKMSDAAKATKGKRSVSAEQRKKISDSLKGRSIPIEVREKISQSLTGESNPFFGKSHSEESRKKISEANKGRCPSKHIMDSLHSGNKKKIYCSTNGITFNSVSDAAAFFGKSASYISNILSGRCKNKYNIHIFAGWEAAYESEYCVANPTAAYCMPPVPPTEE
jgi:group I intron endonuclease